MAEEKKIKFGWGIEDTHCEPDTYDTVEKLLEAAQESWDNQDGNPFDSDCDYSGCIYVGTAETFSPSDFAPSLDDIADQMTDKFYCVHNIDDDAEVNIAGRLRKEADAAWKELVNKYFDLPCTMVCNNNIGVYDLKSHKWVEEYEAFNKFVKED